MIISPSLADVTPLRAAVRAAALRDEATVVTRLLDILELPDDVARSITTRARTLTKAVRERQASHGGLDSFLQEFDLSSKEGVVMMCLAEALLRVPDADTVDKLIKDKLASADWSAHVGRSESLFVNASTWALMLTGRVMRLDEEPGGEPAGFIKRLVSRSGEPVVRAAITQAMRILGRQFVMGRTIADAMQRARTSDFAAYRFSFDMLGEAARTRTAAAQYYDAYRDAIAAIGADPAGRSIDHGPGLSVKLSALHPRFEFAQRERVIAELIPAVRELARAAAAHDIGMTIDSEEAARLDVSMDVIEAVALDPALAGWQGLGVAVQAYQKRAVPLIAWLADVARRGNRRLMVRLVKGAYWDTEIKRAQVDGLDDYPVFTRKSSTDLSYLVCAQRLIAEPDAFFPQFATHNARTVAEILTLARPGHYEFQRLHGMGEALYDHLTSNQGDSAVPCRVYAPVGSHQDLLPYLVRRLLENGANTSFVNRLHDEQLPIDQIIADPVSKSRALTTIRHPRIPLPRDLFGPERQNSTGVDTSEPSALHHLGGAMREMAREAWHAAPIVGGKTISGGLARPITDPADRRRTIGQTVDTGPQSLEHALNLANAAQPAWDRTDSRQRAATLNRMADLIEANRALLAAMCVREAGKTIPDAIAETREAADFCRYYATIAATEFAVPMDLPGPTGESNSLSLHGRGVFACISPWNFPLAIFTGQVAAALAAGNAVVAKPAEQTPLVAAAAVAMFHEAGIPGDVLHLLPGDGPSVGAPLVADPRVSGVAFTGSIETAKAIHRALAARDGPIIPLIAETGGQNAMIVDSTALPEQVVDDVITSSFRSAGQRCSALRVLFLQSDIADRVLDMLIGAMQELTVGDPAWLATDVGPVIDADAKRTLQRHARRMARGGGALARTPLPSRCRHGTFVAPMVFEIDALDQLDGEVFGPILHVIRYDADALGRVLAAIDAAGFGLTLGVHTRIDSAAAAIHGALRIGNSYVNRNMIGAVVGVQPFGGERLSGTGPKAGGPHYLHQFATERALTINTAATGGNAALLAMDDDVPAAPLDADQRTHHLAAN